MGPWQTLVTLDVGLPVAGPDHGFVLYLVFLKLFRRPPAVGEWVSSRGD
jgi:hypothetical protein